MERLRRIFNPLLGRLRPLAPFADISALSEQARQKALEEARFLHSRHAVDVKSLAPGETPGLPRRADED